MSPKRETNWRVSPSCHSSIEASSKPKSSTVRRPRRRSRSGASSTQRFSCLELLKKSPQKASSSSQRRRPWYDLPSRVVILP